MKVFGDLAVGILVLSFIIIYLMTGVDNSIPLFLRVKFDNTCNKYLAEMSINGGLNSSKKVGLKQELERKGFTNINISAEENVQWGSESTLKVKAEYKGKKLDENLKRIDDIKVFNYETSTGIYGLEN